MSRAALALSLLACSSGAHATDPTLAIEPWQVFPSEGGAELTFEGDMLAVAGEARLVLYRGPARLWYVDASWPSPGAPRFSEPGVLWGPHAVELASGRATIRTEALPEVRPGAGERPYAYAWSPDGRVLVGSFTADPRVSLFVNGRATTLWERSGVAPQAVWVGEQALVVGFGDPQVFRIDGTPLTRIALGGVVVSVIAADRSGRRLIVVDENRAIALVDGERFTVLDRWPGAWMHAAINPRGDAIAGLDMSGGLHFARIESDRMVPTGNVQVIARAGAVALSDEEIAVVGGGEVRRARWHLGVPGW